ncbi:inositol polyphosphate 5-phosphatase 1 [Striga asiatica]|uniref:Inositol polyphosphate 5-phosphatase 1 n=1 Tax=Striga asiatica TaxID=4170 RepID=A0A5A7QXP1_STRAF|nr:inositol polyphosphate 5-phosphatase 1 [Striga asiatica]
MRTRRNSSQQHEVSWRRLVVRKWLNLAKSDSDYSADTESGSGSDSEQESFDWPKQSRFKNDKVDEPQVDVDDPALPKLRRRNSETFRAQYINNKEIRVCAATWNVGGRVPPDDLDVNGWLDIDDPADIYVIGLQEIIPLNAGNIFGAEDSRPVAIWENIIREALNRVQPVTKFKSFSDPPSPSRFKPAEDAPDIEDEILLESDSDVGEEIYPLNEEPNVFSETDGGLVEGRTDDSVLKDEGQPIEPDLARQFSSPKRLDRLNCLRTEEDGENNEGPNSQYNRKLIKTFSGTERIGLSWPEPPLHLLPKHVLEKPNSFQSYKSFKSSKSFRTCNSFKSNVMGENRMKPDIGSLLEVDLESIINRKRRPQYVRIVSKQMVGIFITIWVRRSLRRHIQNVNVSTVGVGVMGYIGNKICSVLMRCEVGESDLDMFSRRIFWLGDLNYRINLSYDQTRNLISKKDWSKLIEKDQLSKEFKKGRAFDGWSEGTLNFAPTYKYELNSESYVGEDPKAGRRTPAWCDRILSFGTGIRLLSYRRCEVRLSDHRPVTAMYMVEVEVFSPRKLQRALTFTDAEVEHEDIITDVGLVSGMGLLRSGEDASYWER